MNRLCTFLGATILPRFAFLVVNGGVLVGGGGDAVVRAAGLRLFVYDKYILIY